jgi:hypothetical protein
MKTLINLTCLALAISAIYLLCPVLADEGTGTLSLGLPNGPGLLSILAADYPVVRISETYWRMCFTNGVSGPISVLEINVADGRILRELQVHHPQISATNVVSSSTMVVTNENLTNRIGFSAGGTNFISALKRVFKSEQEMTDFYINRMESDNALTNVINLLVSSGKFCEIKGHAWIQKFSLTADLDPNRSETRQCTICGKWQSKRVTISDWQ